MKKIGILGGLAWPSTIEYYQTICRLSQQWHTGKSFDGPTPMPEFSIESLNINYTVNHRGTAGDESSWREWDAYLSNGLKRLQASGADFAVIASNTPHNRFDAITAGIDMPVISVFDAIAQLCKQNDLDEFLLLGTAPTMNLPAYSHQLQQRGIASFVPDESGRQAVLNLINQLYTGNTCGADSALTAVVEQSFAGLTEEVKPVVCLACTELPLAFADFKNHALFEYRNITYINTAVVHATAAFNYAVANN